MNNAYIITSIILSLIILNSHSEFKPDNQSRYPEKQKYTVASSYGSDTIKDFIRYEPIKGKILGIWPSEEIWKDLEKFKRLKHSYGFTKTLIKPYKNNVQQAINAGFDSSNIAALYWSPNYTKDVYGIGSIYADEPDQNYYKKNLKNYSPDSIKRTYQNLKLKSPGTKFIIGTFKRIKDQADNWKIAEEFRSNYEPFTDVITYTDYYCNCGNLMDPEDQRPSWVEMKELYGDKFTMVWIGAHKDTLDYDLLFDEAHLLGISEIWLYQYQDPHKDFCNVEKFCEIAYQKGWLKKIESTFFRD